MTLRTILMLVCLTSTAVLAQAPQAQTPASTPALTPPAVRSLPVTKVVLYKTGVGYFEHLGSINGPEAIAIQFTNAQLDDVLKSLTTLDLGEGRVTGVSYESPTPVSRRLQALRLPLGEGASSIDVLGALRGAAVDVRAADGATYSGRLLNIEKRQRPLAGGGTMAIDEISLVSPRGEIVGVELTTGTRVMLADADLRRELNEYLDVAGATRDRDVRRMQIATAGSGTRPLFVSYVTEAAVWKTTYRLVFPPTGNGAPILQGWAIVDNMSAEDWPDVELSLVAGAPQTFTQQISAPLFTRRPQLPLPASLMLAPQRHDATLVEGQGIISGTARDSSGGVLPGVVIEVVNGSRFRQNAVTDGRGQYRLLNVPAGQVTLTATLPGFKTVRREGLTVPAGFAAEVSFVMQVGGIEETVTVTGGVALVDVQSAARVQRLDRDAIDNIPTGRTVQGLGSMTMGVRGFSAAGSPVPGMGQLQPGEMPTAASELGDLFEYRLTDRITIRRNESALVPILQKPIEAERVSLWSPGMGLRPRNAVWLVNTSGLTLDAGSISIVDRGAFAGEGIVDPIKPGEKRLLSYAADLGVQVTSAPAATSGRMRVIRIANGMMVTESEQRGGQTYTVRNDNRDERVVVIEHPIRNDWRVTGDVPPAESTARVHRFRVKVAPHDTSTLQVAEVQPGTVQYTLTQLDVARLSMIVEDDTHRASVERALQPLFAIRVEQARIDNQRQIREAEILSIRSDQTRIRENMRALTRTDEERRLLVRYTEQLDAQEDRLEELSKELKALIAEREAAEREMHRIIETISLEIML